MACINKNECEDEQDIHNVEVNEVQTLAEDREEMPTIYNTVHYSERVGRETFLVVSWSCGEPEYRVCITLDPSSLHPDGYLYEKGKFKDLEDAHDSFQVFVNRAQKAQR